MDKKRIKQYTLRLISKPSSDVNLNDTTFKINENLKNLLLKGIVNQKTELNQDYFINDLNRYLIKGFISNCLSRRALVVFSCDLIDKKAVTFKFNNLNDRDYFINYFKEELKTIIELLNKTTIKQIITYEL